MGANLGRRGGKPATNRLSYGAVPCKGFGFCCINSASFLFPEGRRNEAQIYRIYFVVDFKLRYRNLIYLMKSFLGSTQMFQGVELNKKLDETIVTSVNNYVGTLVIGYPFLSSTCICSSTV
jgi:hypothetical protein